jgi:hypothetical protein
MRVLVATTALALATAAGAGQGTDRPSAEIEKDLKETKREYRRFEDLQKKLERAARQTANTARVSAIDEFQDFMGDCIIRREQDLGQEITIKQHGEDVTTGTTDVSEVGSPVPGSKRGKGAAVFDGPNAGRLRQLSLMKSLYVSSKNNARPAAEQQTGAWDRYMTTVQRFGDQLVLAISKMEIELDKRRDETGSDDDVDEGDDSTQS